MLYQEEKWVLMSEDRKIIAKGVPRNRYICLVNESNKRILTYTSKGKAKASSRGFYQSDGVRDYLKQLFPDKLMGDIYNLGDIEDIIKLEPIKVIMSIDVQEEE